MGGLVTRMQGNNAGEASGPKSFYLLLGSPSIRYVKGPSQGPLIFDVVPMQLAQDAVEHAETLQTICNIPTKQPFGLKEDHTGGGYKVVFRLDCLPHAAPTSVRVLVGVKIDYREGFGLRIVPSDPENEQFCVLDQKRFNQACDIDLDRMLSIRLEKLTPCANAAELQLPKSLTACPIAIVVESDVFYDADAAATDDERAASAVHKHIQYTFLNFRKDGVKKATAAKQQQQQQTPARGGGAGSDNDEPEAGVEMQPEQAATALVPLTLLKQYLQMDFEVFELDDIYDLGGDAKTPAPKKERDPQDDGMPDGEGGGGGGAAAPTEEEVGAEVEDVCVVCLSNPKDTTILPCRHMCLCADCAGQLRTATNKCPICRQQIGKLMTMHT